MTGDLPSVGGSGGRSGFGNGGIANGVGLERGKRGPLGGYAFLLATLFLIMSNFKIKLCTYYLNISVYWIFVPPTERHVHLFLVREKARLSGR